MSAAAPNCRQAANKLAFDQLRLLRAAAKGVAVLKRAANKVLDRLVDAAVRANLVDVVAVSAERKGQVVRHPQKLPEVESRTWNAGNAALNGRFKKVGSVMRMLLCLRSSFGSRRALTVINNLQENARCKKFSWPRA